MTSPTTEHPVPLTVRPGICTCTKFAPGHAPGLHNRWTTCTGDVPDTDADRAAAQAQAALAATSDEELLTKHAHLTHRIHAVESDPDDAWRSARCPVCSRGWQAHMRGASNEDCTGTPVGPAAEPRAMRDLVTAECLRRMGGNR